MNILVIDTATEACSVALEVNRKIYNRFDVCPQQHSQRILPMIDEVITEAGVSIQELDYLGFGRGPGSFTGVRIATGVLQGLSLGTGHKVIGISTLAAMAQQAMTEHEVKNVFCAIDARMSEVYFAQYHAEKANVTLTGYEQVVPPEQALELISLDSASVAVGTGWRAYPQLESSNIKILDDILYPDAKYMLPLAKRLAEEGKATDAENIKPVYLRDKVTWKKLPGRE